MLSDNIRAALKKIPWQAQRQDGLIDQLRLVANRLGCYDAADYIWKIVEQSEKSSP